MRTTRSRATKKKAPQVEEIDSDSPEIKMLAPHEEFSEAQFLSSKTKDQIKMIDDTDNHLKEEVKEHQSIINSQKTKFLKSLNKKKREKEVRSTQLIKSSSRTRKRGVSSTC